MNAGLETTNVRTMAMSPLNQDILYVGTNGSGLYWSVDAGRNWRRLPLALKPSIVAS